MDHFLPFCPLKTYTIKILRKWRKYQGILLFYICVPKMEHDQYNFLSFWTIFCTFIPLTTWKIQTFEKMKTSHGYIIILHMCTIRYGVWERYFLKFWTVFCPFTYTHTPLHSCPTPNNTENKNYEKMKKHQEISFYTCVQ